MSRFWKIALIVVAVIVVGAVGFRLLHKPAAEDGATGQHRGQHKGQGQGDGQGGANGQDKDAAPVPVTVEPVAKQDVPIYLTALGTVQALNTVTVNPQISGQMLSINFKEGQELKKGDLLAQITLLQFLAFGNTRHRSIHDGAGSGEFTLRLPDVWRLVVSLRRGDYRRHRSIQVGGSRLGCRAL